MAVGWRQCLTTLQLAQFVAISLQSYLAYARGAECGAPDWAKVVMMLYMGSMLVLFGNFFLQRYIFRAPEAEMCSGVEAGGHPEQLQCNGISTLNSAGEAIVSTPPWFRGGAINYQLTCKKSSALRSTLIFPLSAANLSNCCM